MKDMRVAEIAFVLHGDAWAALLALAGQDSAWMLDLAAAPDAPAGLERLRGLGILLEGEDTVMIEPVYRGLTEGMGQMEVILRVSVEPRETLLFPSARLPLLAEKLSGGMLKICPVEDLGQAFEEIARRVPTSKQVPVAALGPAGTLWNQEMDRETFQRWAGQMLAEGGEDAWIRS